MLSFTLSSTYNLKPASQWPAIKFAGHEGTRLDTWVYRVTGGRES